MKISEYVINYTAGNRIHLFGNGSVFAELVEYFNELMVHNKKGAAEEWEDFLHFLQLWLYWRFGLNQPVWRSTRHSVAKFIARVEVWRKLYKYCGLPENISGYAGNDKKVEKVITQLGKFGINEEKAKLAYKHIVQGDIEVYPGKF